ESASAKRRAWLDDTEAGRGDERPRGRRQRDRARASGPSGRGHHQRRAMNLPSFIERYGRAILTVTVVLAAAGVIAGLSLPSDIYPPLVFPRVVVIAHSGTTPRHTLVL